MNSAEFFMAYCGNRMLAADQRSGDAIADAAKVLAISHPLSIAGKSLRLSSAWMVITPAKVTTSFKAHPSCGFDTSGTTDRKTAIRAALKQGDCMLLAFSKRSMQVADLFITYDPRAARLCAPGETKTYDATEDKEWTS